MSRLMSVSDKQAFQDKRTMKSSATPVPFTTSNQRSKSGQSKPELQPKISEFSQNS